jgi:hypothetical protein
VNVITHANNPELILKRKGDTTTHARVSKRFKEWLTAMESGHKHKENNQQLTPSEVTKLRSYLLSNKTYSDIQQMTGQ